MSEYLNEELNWEDDFGIPTEPDPLGEWAMQIMEDLKAGKIQVDLSEQVWCEEEQKYYPRWIETETELMIMYKEEFIYLPLMDIPEIERKPYEMGVWSSRRMKYLETEKPIQLEIITEGLRLHQHLMDTDMKAMEMEQELTEKLKAENGVTEQLKANNPTKWLNKMNSIRKQVEETIYKELIYK
ncbi:MAG: TnpV protein [Firmicutes bacterium]|nr:TnpV protein [Bacillota bacterium]